MSKKVQVIGLSGCARAGKDTFASVLVKRLTDLGYKVKTVALAQPLKQYCDQFLKENLGISAFTQITDEKNLIRPLLVWFGDAKRRQTNGRFWVDLATKTIREHEENGADFVIVTDVRYDHYEKDEVSWLKDEMNGKLVHVSRILPDGSFVQPANDHEAINDPKVNAKADLKVVCPTFSGLTPEQLLTHPEILIYAVTFLKKNYDIP